MPPRSRNSHLLDQVQPGDEIEVWWPHDAQYYSGVVGTTLPSGRHRIFYNDGEIEDLKLVTEQWRFIGVAAKRILSSHTAPSLDPPSDGPQPHQPDSQPDHDQPSNDVQPTPPATNPTTTTGKKRGRPRGRKSTAKTPKPKPGRPSQTSSSSAANEAQNENKPDSARPAASSQQTSAAKPKAPAVKKRQRSSSTPAQNTKSKPAKPVVTTGAAPSSDADDGLIDAAPLAPKPTSSPADPSSAPTAHSPTPTPSPASAPTTTTATASSSVVSPAQTDDPPKELDIISKPSHTPDLIPPAPSVVKRSTSKSTTTPATTSARSLVPAGKTPAKKSNTAAAQGTSTPKTTLFRNMVPTVKAPAKKSSTTAQGTTTPTATPTRNVVPPGKTPVKKSTTATAQGTTSPMTTPVRNVVPPAKKSTSTTAQTSPSKAFCTPRSNSAHSQAKTTKPLPVTRKAPGTNGPSSQSVTKKANTSTSVQRKAVPIAPVIAASSMGDDTPLATLLASPRAGSSASKVAPSAHSKSQNGKETAKTTATPPKHSPPKGTGNPDTVKGVEMASVTTQQKTFILAANGTIQEKPPQPSPKSPAPVKEKQGTRSQPKQVKPQPATADRSRRAVGPMDTTGTSQTKMAITTIVSDHNQQNKASITRPDGRPPDPSSGKAKGQDVTKQGTNGLKKRDSVLHASQKGFAKSKGTTMSKSLGVKKTISKPAKMDPTKRLVTHAFQVSESSRPVKPQDGSDIVADVTVPRRSKGGITSPLLGSPSRPRPSLSSPRKPLPAASGTGFAAKARSDLKKLTLDQASPKRASSEDYGTQDKDERPGSKLGPFQPTRRRLKRVKGGVAHQGRQKSTAKPTHQKPIQQSVISGKERPHPLLEPQKLNNPREQVAASEPQGAKSIGGDEMLRKAPQHSKTPTSKDLQGSQASAPNGVSVTETVTKAQPVSLSEQRKAQTRTKQAGGDQVVDETRSKQVMQGVNPVSDASGEMEIDESTKTGVKRAASEALKSGKRRRPNPPKATASNATVNTDSETVKGKTPTTAANGGLETHKKTNLSPTADVTKVAASNAQSQGSQEISNESTSVVNVAAPQRACTKERESSGNGNHQVRSSRNSSVPSHTPVNAPLGKTDQPLKNLTPKAPALAASKEPQPSRVGENQGGRQDSNPSLTSPPKSFARVRQRLSAGSGRPSSTSQGVTNLPKDASEMSASSAIDAIKQAVREANMESLQPQLAPVVTRIEKCFADSDRRVRSLQGQLDRSTKALESLQKQLEDLKKTISYVPSTSEVRSLLDSQSLEMKRATEECMESIISAVKEDMKNYFPREIKTGMENVAALVQKDSIMMISRAVDSAMTSGLLRGSLRATEPIQTNPQQNTNSEPRPDVANQTSVRETAPGSAVMHSNLNRRRLEGSAEARRPTDPSRRTGPGLGTSGGESKRDGPAGNVAKESTRAPANVRERQPALTSNGPTTSGFERDRRVSRPNGNDRFGGNQKTPEGRGTAQGEGANINSEQNLRSQGAQPSPNGFHPDSSPRTDATRNDTPGGQVSGVHSNGLSVTPKSSTVPRRSQSEAPLAKREKYGYISYRMKALLARSAVEWFLKGGCRDFAPQNERTSRVSEKWIKDSVQRCLSGLLGRLQQQEEFKDAMITLTHSVGAQIQADWLLKGPTTANINIARKNYEEWDPRLFDFEWESEKRVLAKLSETLLHSEKLLMTAGEFLEDPLQTAIRCVERASTHFSS